jgi:uncharacterized protein (TIGR02594 family)
MTNVYAIALGELGVEEQTGILHTARILHYFSATNLRATSDETPWCAAFVNWCLREAGVEGTHSARAASFLTWGRSIPLAEARQGDIVIFPHHVGFFVDWSDSHHIFVLGGNQSNRVNMTHFKISTILSIRRTPMSLTPKTPSIVQWITSAPTLLQKTSRLISSAQAKDWTTSVAALVALLAYLAQMMGLPIDENVVHAINALALAIVGFFTGKQVVNPQKVDASYDARVRAMQRKDGSDGTA